jgi:hypothetical protein
LPRLYNLRMVCDIRLMNTLALTTHYKHQRFPGQIISLGRGQRFLAAFGPMAQYFRQRPHRLPVSAYWQEMRQRFDT